MSRTTRRMIIVGMLSSLLLAGCHKPTFGHLEPTTEKWAMTVLAQAENDQEKAAVETLLNQFGQEHRTAAFQVKWVTAADADTTLKTVAEQSTVDLVVLAADVKNAPEIAAGHPDKRFTFLGGVDMAAGKNVRHLKHDRNKMLFLAGVIAAEANRSSSEPFGVLVDQPISESDERWKMIVAGARYAGRKDAPVQVLAGQPQLSGRAMVLLSELPKTLEAQVKQERTALIRTDEKYANLELEAHVIAEPVSLLTTALPSEAKALTTEKWQGEQAKLPVKGMYDLRQVDIVPTQFASDLGTRLEIIEAQLASGTIKPEEILADKIQ